MSIAGTCHDNGMSNRCNIEDCEKFWDGDCPNHEETISDAEQDDYYEDILDDNWDKISKLYPKTTDGINNQNKEN